jgi:hypothetical protein
MADKNKMAGRIVSWMTMAAFAVAVALNIREPVSTARVEHGPGSQDVPEGADSATQPAVELLLLAPEAHSEDAQILEQHKPGWKTPQPHDLPKLTYAPAMTAFGIVFLALGVVTKWPLSIIGAIIFFIAIAKWIGELLHD